jgi:hypothetical protein
VCEGERRHIPEACNYNVSTIIRQPSERVEM